MNERDTSPKAYGWVGLVLLVGCALLAGLIETLLVPLYAGKTGWVAPVSVPLAVVTNIVFPRWGVRLVERGLGAVLPFVAWLVVILGFGVVTRPEGDVILPGAPASVEWVTYGTMLAGGLAGLITVVLSIPPPPGRQVSAGTGRGSPPSAPPGRR